MKEFSAKLLLQVIDLCNVNNLAVYAEYCGEWLHVNGVNSEIGVCINQKGYPMMGNPCYHGITGSPIVDYHGDGDKEPLMSCIREIMLPVYDPKKVNERFNVIVTGDYDKKTVGFTGYYNQCQEWIKNHTELLCEIHVR